MAELGGWRRLPFVKSSIIKGKTFCQQRRICVLKSWGEALKQSTSGLFSLSWPVLLQDRRPQCLELQGNLMRKGLPQPFHSGEKSIPFLGYPRESAWGLPYQRLPSIAQCQEMLLDLKLLLRRLNHMSLSWLSKCSPKYAFRSGKK